MSKLGELHAIIPWATLESQLPDRAAKKGPTPYFSNRGMIALMFLKHYTGLSDSKLIESINHNTSHQLFCGMKLGNLELVRDTGIVSRVRSHLARHLDLELFQQELAGCWKADISQPNFMKMDATCFESHIRYPTDSKLLWECCQWVYGRLFQMRKTLGIPLGKPKERYDEQKRKQLSYSRLQRKAHKKTGRRIKSLLHLLNRGCWLMIDLLKDERAKLLTGSGFYQRLDTVFRIHDQQKFLRENPGQKVKGRIVSLHKPYLRPIKRGKERKPNEFGAKVHMLQSDGLCIIEHLDWDAFHEGKRLEASIEMHERLLAPCHQLSADRAYASNGNRKHCTKMGIQTGFAGKGRKPPKPIRKLKAALNLERSTRLEGAFGNQKNNYLLARVKARNASNEKLWIFFGVFTANAVWVSKKRKKTRLEMAA